MLFCMVDYEEIGRRMKAKRRSLRRSQEEIANAINISVSFYGNIERGKRIPSVDTLVAIANELDVSADYLLSGSLTAAMAKRPDAELRLIRQYLRDRVAELDYSEMPQIQGAD